jgi:hypothetical protein
MRKGKSGRKRDVEIEKNMGEEWGEKERERMRMKERRRTRNIEGKRKVGTG